MAFMKLPLKLSLNSELRECYIFTNQQKERHRSFPILLKYFAAIATIILEAYLGLQNVKMQLVINSEHWMIQKTFQLKLVIFITM